MLIVWDKLFETGISEIDIQHKKLVNIINKVHDSFSNKGSVDNLSQVLDELVDYTKYHFTTEEDYFEEFDYPDKIAHLREHRDFTEKVETFIADYKNGKATVSYELINFLKEWLINHILDSDKKYVPLFRQNGL